MTQIGAKKALTLDTTRVNGLLSYSHSMVEGQPGLNSSVRS